MCDDATEILHDIEQGDREAAADLLPMLYKQLRHLAARKLADEPSAQTLQPTALVHEAYIRLVDKNRAEHWDSLGHFYAAAAEAMRRILVENARRKQAIKHGGGRQKLNLDQADLGITTDPERLVMLDEALARLAAEDTTGAQLVKLHIFAGLSLEQAARFLHISRTTAYRRWSYARAWLRVEMGKPGSGM